MTHTVKDIIRYKSNRKLYNYTDSKYIKRSKLVEYFHEKVDFKVSDQEGNDITMAELVKGLGPDLIKIDFKQLRRLLK